MGSLCINRNASKTPEQKLDNWFIKPLEQLKSSRTPDSDGAFLALCGAVALYERFVVASLKNVGTKPSPDAVQTFGATDLGITEDQFNKFWRMYRHGANHAFQPKQFTSSGTRYGWEISGDYNAIPEFEQRESDLMIVKLNPWAFAELVAQRFKDNSALLDISNTNKLADVSYVPTTSELPATKDDSTILDGPGPSGVFPASSGNHPDA